ncbi:sigma-70 family RNA polymerase sigma factor [Mobilitalea sibirica]|uniref:Sigma-70 family RNA polymerase sigma factor n=1 Tax=Mobilitalea sibirica TaxID=1462919 RepID=A0A8J7KSC7_9FIRM|nr:sigma-70 family RNA polymerase sigma factor [Mobilitalea sibirica]MBH1940176.1 sigma-70 family RNA polymerase sigma factor [Mobilitalea sibirica]
MLSFILTIEDVKKRDKMEDLYITYRKELFYISYQILHSYHDAEDVIQNAFIKIYKHLDKIGEIKCKKTRAYLVIVVRNLSFDRYNEKKRIMPTEFTDGLEIDDTSLSLDEHVLNLERGKELAEALSKINSGYADILSLRYYYEMSLTEIGDLLNLSTDNVCVKIHRAKAALKKILSEGGVTNE